jgi:hypothetical protein
MLLQATQRPLDELESEIAVVFANIQVATHRLLLLIAELDRRGEWGYDGGFRTTAHWLSWRLGLDIGAAREKVRVARALESLPKISQALAEGRLSYSKVRAITRVADAENEESLLAIAMTAATCQVERLIRLYRRNEKLELEQGEAQYQARTLSTYVDENGMWVIEGRLPPELGAIVQQALDTARAAMDAEADQTKNSAQRSPVCVAQADALVHMAQQALAAQVALSEQAVPLLTVHVDAELLCRSDELDPEAGEVEVNGRAELAGTGNALSAETCRRLGCDASVIAMIKRGEEVLSVGRQRRTVPTAIRRAVDERDKGCRYPGCGARRFLHAHHVIHWADGGETKISNIISLCGAHHRWVHEGGYRVERSNAGEFVFHAPSGAVLEDTPPLRRAHDDDDLFFGEHHRMMSVVTAPDILQAWQGERPDYDYLLQLISPLD